MRDVRRLVVAGPWPAQVAHLLGVYGVIGWPFALRTEWPPSGILSSMIMGLALPPVQRWQEARKTGWAAAERYAVLTRAYAGNLPADPVDRTTLYQYTARHVREDRTGLWFVPVVCAVWAVGAVVWRDTFRGWSEWPVAAYYVLLGVGGFVLVQRRQARRKALLADLDGVGRAVDG